MKTIFVVDDDQERAEKTSRVLQLLDVEVKSFTNSVLALGEMEKNKPDLMVVDLFLPEMDGIQFVREARKLGVTASVIMLTNCEDVPHLKLLPSNKIEAVLLKSMSNADLAVVVGRVLGQRCLEGVA
jgi:CheY-like chemotaxis protein